MSRSRAMAGKLLAAALVVGGCKAKPSSSTQASSAKPTPSAPVSAAAQGGPVPGKPPIEPFKLEPWKSPFKDVQPVTPPESLLQPWRVFVNGERPRQKKNPRWRSVPAREAATLEMPPGSPFQCIVNPLEIRARTDDDAKEVLAWVIQRRIRCSSDGWATWTEDPYVVIVDPDGATHPTVQHLELFLRARLPDGSVRETTLLMRADKEPSGKATKGPPRVLGSTEPAPPASAAPSR